LAVGLFLLAPFVGEFVLGNQPITELPMLPVLAPMYGGGALLIREAVRRTGGGWPVIIVLAAAYALLEEGPIDQMLFNPAYVGLDNFAELGPIPGLGISATLLQGSLTLHTVWSICVPIAIVEAFDRELPRPWLGDLGLTVVGIVFVLGSTGLALLQYATFRFIASPLQFSVVGTAIVALIGVAALLTRRTAQTHRHGRDAARPVLVAAAAFGLSSVALALGWLTGPWVSLTVWGFIVAGSAFLLARSSQRPQWGRSHRLAVASGCLLTYVWYGFLQSASLGIAAPIAVLGNTVFGASAIVLVGIATRAERRHAAAKGQATQSATAVG
jgi:hypothetical protein